MKTTLSLIALVLGLSLAVRAEEAKAPDHEQHHAEAGKDDKAGGHEMMMGGKMDMKKMHEMMGECMKMHKDGKMCEGQTMEQCQKDMSKEDCSKMMKKSKTDKK